MRAWTWKIAVVLAFIAVIVWQRIETARMDERYRLLVERQNRIDRLVENVPTMLEIAFERHRQKMIVYMESRDD